MNTKVDMISEAWGDGFATACHLIRTHFKSYQSRHVKNAHMNELFKMFLEEVNLVERNMVSEMPTIEVLENGETSFTKRCR